MGRPDVKHEAYLGELLEIRAANPNGLLLPEEVVRYAEDNPDCAIRSRFEWNDGEAAHQWRLEQARTLIRYVIKFIPVESKIIEYQAFVSLPSDRQNRQGGGYRLTHMVLSDAEHRRELLVGALRDLKVFREKYRMLTELAGVFAEIDKITAPDRLLTTELESMPLVAN